MIFIVKKYFTVHTYLMLSQQNSISYTISSEQQQKNENLNPVFWTKSRASKCFFLIVLCAHYLIHNRNSIITKPRVNIKCICCVLSYLRLASQVVLVVKSLPANAGDIKARVQSLGWEKFPEEGHGNPLQYNCLGTLMDRGAWRATVHGDINKSGQDWATNTLTFRYHLNI